MKTIICIASAFLICSCSPVQIQADNYPSKYPETPTMGDVERASKGSL